MFAVLLCPLNVVKHCCPHTFSTIDQAALFNIVCLANTQWCRRLQDGCVCWPLCLGYARKELVCIMCCPTTPWIKSVYSCLKNSKTGVLKLFDHPTSSSVWWHILLATWIFISTLNPIWPCPVILLKNILQQRYWFICPCLLNLCGQDRLFRSKPPYCLLAPLLLFNLENTSIRKY